VVAWNAAITWSSRNYGLSVEFGGQLQPKVVDSTAVGHYELDLVKMHVEQLPARVELDSAIGEFKSVLEGSWQFSASGRHTYSLSNPLFSRRGDLVAQICCSPFATNAEPTPRTPGIGKRDLPMMRTASTSSQPGIGKRDLPMMRRVLTSGQSTSADGAGKAPADDQGESDVESEA